jgi:lipopolysaccharide export system protein LptA
MIRTIILLAALGLAAPAPAQTTVDTTAAAAEAKGPKDVDIEANQMVVLDEQKKAVFTGKVIGKRGAVTLNCDKLVVDYVETEQKDGTKKTEVTYLDATGSVVIVTSKQTVTGEWAKMNVKTNEVTVGGNVKVVQDKTVLTGQKLFVDLDTNRSEMTGGRVKGSFVPKQ